MLGNGESNSNNQKETLPSELLFMMIDTLCTKYSGANPYELYNAPTYQVFEIFVSTILLIREQNGEEDNVNYITNEQKPIPIKNGGWF